MAITSSSPGNTGQDRQSRGDYRSCAAAAPSRSRWILTDPRERRVDVLSFGATKSGTLNTEAIAKVGGSEKAIFIAWVSASWP